MFPAVVIASVFAALLVGALVGLGGYFFVAPFALLVPGALLLSRPGLCLTVYAILALLVAGVAQYFFGFGKLQWALSALGLALLAYSVAGKMFSDNDSKDSGAGLVGLLLSWWGLICFSSLANYISTAEWFVGVRTYLPAVGVFACVAYCRLDDRLLKRVILLMGGVACLQWTFCLYQRFKVVPLRVASNYPGSPWDSIVGSFGGDKFGGGESGSLAVFIAIAIVMAAALAKQGQLSKRWLFVLVLTSLATMALAEAKVIALLVPFGLLVVFRTYVFKKPVRFLFGSVMVLVSMCGVLIAYYYMYWQDESKLGLIDSVVRRFAYSFDPHFQASTTNLGRVKSLLYWWDQHSLLSDPLTLLFGHGLASAVSSSSVIGEGVAVAKYGYMLDVTGVSKLLWESGLFGTLIFVLIFVVGSFRAVKLALSEKLPTWHRASMEGIVAVMLLMPLSIFYELTVVGSSPMQFIAMFFLGYIVYWWRKSQEVQRV